MSFDTYGGLYKGQSPDTFRYFSVYREGHFIVGYILHIAASMMGISLKNSLSTCYIEGHISRRLNQLLPHIVSSIRGIFSKRLIVILGIVKGIFHGELIGI